ncbi:Uncharacterised protein [Actinobacillus equuli]|nr:Uncharacterised protein [Actinobacillus equuli]
MAKQWLTIAPDANYVGTPEENAKLRIQELTNSANIQVLPLWTLRILNWH